MLLAGAGARALARQGVSTKQFFFATNNLTSSILQPSPPQLSLMFKGTLPVRVSIKYKFRRNIAATRTLLWSCGDLIRFAWCRDDCVRMLYTWDIVHFQLAKVPWQQLCGEWTSDSKPALGIYIEKPPLDALKESHLCQRLHTWI